MPDIQILSTKRFRFQNPAVKTSLLAAQPGSTVLSDAFFTTEPMVVQSAPDWIQQDQLFDWAQEAGELKVVTVAVPKAKKATTAKSTDPAAPATDPATDPAATTDPKPATE
jgi:hypothetical protein